MSSLNHDASSISSEKPMAKETRSSLSPQPGDSTGTEQEPSTAAGINTDRAGNKGSPVDLTKSVEEADAGRAAASLSQPEVQAAADLEHLHLTSTPPRVPAKTSPTKPLPATPPSRPASEAPYLDPTPKTPLLSRLPTRESSDYGPYNEKDPRYGPDPPLPENEEKRGMPLDESVDKNSQSEIQSIMDQFSDGTGGPRHEEIMYPRMDLVGPMQAQFPIRQSSLEPVRSVDSRPVLSPISTTPETESSSPPLVPPKPNLTPVRSKSIQAMNSSSPISNSGPPPPEPEPDLPFDFHRFLEQLRHKSADPVAKFLRSFLTEFGKKQWMVHEQVKIIGDFLAFITNKMALCDVWRDVSDAEFDNAKEGMEKLVMNRLYAQTFSPAIAPPAPLARSKSKRKDQERGIVSGRRGQHQEDVERDDILAQKVRIYGWVKEDHLDIPPVGSNGQRFLKLAQQELLKIKGYRAPRDKVICVLNCCKVIFGLLKNAKSPDTSADSFVPLLIYVVLQANPEHLVSNIQYIFRFRNQDKLGGQAGYYLSSLSGAIQFIENLDQTSLTVSDEDFERNVEVAVSAIAETNREAEVANPPSQYKPPSEKARPSLPEVTARNSFDATYSSPRRSGDGRLFVANDSEEHAAVAGLLRTIQKPLSTIGRIFSEDTNQQRGPATTPQPGSTPRMSPSVFHIPQGSGEERRSEEEPSESHPSGRLPRPAVPSFDAQEAAARQASAEAAEARRIQRAELRNVVE